MDLNSSLSALMSFRKLFPQVKIGGVLALRALGISLDNKLGIHGYSDTNIGVTEEPNEGSKFSPGNRLSLSSEEPINAKEDFTPGTNEDKR